VKAAKVFEALPAFARHAEELLAKLICPPVVNRKEKSLNTGFRCLFFALCFQDINREAT
jgi:hypothetical protein